MTSSSPTEPVFAAERPFPVVTSHAEARPTRAPLRSGALALLSDAALFVVVVFSVPFVILLLGLPVVLVVWALVEIAGRLV